MFDQRAVGTGPVLINELAGAPTLDAGQFLRNDFDIHYDRHNSPL